MKKFYFLFLITLLINTGYIFANGQGESSSSNNGTVKIKFSMWDAVPKNNNFVENFMKENPDIIIEMVSIPADSYSQKLNTMVATNTAPDVMLVWECDLPNFANGDKIVALDDYISDTKSFSAEDFIPAVNNVRKISGGKNYGLPWCYAGEILYYNKNMFDKSGVSYPTNKWTWDDFTNAAKKLTIVENGITTQWGADDMTFGGLWYSTIGAAGDSVIDQSGNLVMGEGLRKTLQWQYDLVNKFKVVPPPSASSAGSDLFLSGRAAMTRTGSWMCSTYRQIENFSWDIAILPKGTRQYSSLHTGFFTISKDSKNKEAAWRFIEYCMSEEGQKSISTAYNNPSAITSFAKDGAYRINGITGPENWSTFDETAQFGQFGYVLATPGLTNDLVKKFQAAVLGQISIDEAIKESQQAIEDNQNY